MPTPGITGEHDHLVLIGSALLDEDRAESGLAVHGSIAQGEDGSRHDGRDVGGRRRIQGIRPSLENF